MIARAGWIRRACDVKLVGLLTLVILVVAAFAPARGADWPQYRGINRDGTSAETWWLQSWPPSNVWRAAIGYGYSQPTVSDGRVYITGTAFDTTDAGYTWFGTDTVCCLDAYTGHTNWTYSYPSDKAGNCGAKATPTVDGTNVYTLSDVGVLYCFNKVTGGAPIWQTNVAIQAGGIWGYAGSPLVDGNLIIVNSGHGAAVDKSTGVKIWGNTGSAGCGSPKAITVNSQRIILMPFSGGSGCLDELTGAPLTGSWGFSGGGAAGAGSEDPEFYGSNIFYSGSGLWQIGTGGVSVVWHEAYPQTLMNPPYSTTVVFGDYVYGFQDAYTLRCDHLTDHATQWTAGMTEGAVIASDGKLICFSGNGQLIIGDASPAGFNTHGRAAYGGVVTLPDNSGANSAQYTAPVLANGLLYCRGFSGDLVCLSCGGASGQWTNQMQITFPGYTNAETLTNFPAYIALSTNLANFSYSQFASTNGYDLRFMSSDGVTNLNYEIERWNTNGNSCVWVQVPQFTTNCFIWAFWGNQSAASAPAVNTTNGAAWSSEFSLVEHMNQTSGSGTTVNDSTAHRDSGVIQNGGVFTNIGIADGCLQLPTGSGANGIALNGTVSVTTNWTLSAWFKGLLPNGADRMLFYASLGGNGGYDIHDIELLGGTDIVQCYASHFNNYQTTPNVIITAASSSNQWQQVTAVGSGGVTVVYLNGVYGGTCADQESPSISCIGYRRLDGYNQDSQFAQYLYDVRIETAGRSANWISASYLTVASNATFTGYGTGLGGPKGALGFSSASYGAMEDDGSAIITVTRTNGSYGPITVNYATADGTASAGVDYTTTTGTLSFASGVTNQTFAIPILNPGIASGSKTLNLSLSTPTGGALMGSPSNAMLTITEDDVPGTVQFSNATYTVMEDGGFATITVARPNGSYGAITVNYVTANGTGTAGTDYTATSGMLSFASGMKNQTFTIPILNVGLYSGSRTVNLSLSNPTGGATLGSQSSAVLTIIEDDMPGTVQFSSAVYSAHENSGAATIMVTRTNGAYGTITVNYATGGGTAIAGTDYTTANSILSFGAGETSKTFTVTLLNNTNALSDVTVNVSLSNPTGGASLGSPVGALLTIFDDNGPACLSGWACKMKVMFSGYNRAETLTNFPALVGLSTNVTGFSYSQFVSTNGYDLRFWSSDGSNSLNYEVGDWKTNGNSHLWVQVPALTNNCYIWACWGSTNPIYAAAAAVCTTNGSTWSSSFALVEHMNETSGITVHDSTASHYSGATEEACAWTSGGIVDDALNLTTSDYRNGVAMTGIDPAIGANWTLSAWVMNMTGSGGTRILFDGPESANGGDADQQIVVDLNNKLGCYISGSFGTLTLTDTSATIAPASTSNNWRQVTAVGTGGNTLMYLDGVYVGKCSKQASEPVRVIGLRDRQTGFTTDNGGQFALDLDEVRVESTARSSNWVWAAWLNMASNLTFNSYGTISGGIVVPTVTAHGIPYSWLMAHGITNTSDSIETQDFNGNGLNVLQDYIAGLDPMNPSSFFLVAITNASGQIVVSIPSIQADATNYHGLTRYYEIDECTNLLMGGAWQSVSGYVGIAANGGILACTNATQDQTKFYRVKARLQ